MNRAIVTPVVVGLLCGLLGFRVGRSGMIPREDCEKYARKVQEGIHDYKRHYYATRRKVSALFDYIDDRKKWFYSDMPESLKTGAAMPQCVTDLFGNLEKWRINYQEQTERWDSQVEAIEKQITSADPL